MRKHLEFNSPILFVNNHLRNNDEKFCILTGKFVKFCLSPFWTRVTHSFFISSKSVATRFKTGLPAIKSRHVGVIYRAADRLMVIIFGCYLN